MRENANVIFQSEKYQRWNWLELYTTLTNFCFYIMGIRVIISDRKNSSIEGDRKLIL